MKLVPLILTVVVSILLGIGIYKFIENNPSRIQQNFAQKINPAANEKKVLAKPTLPPIDGTSNLKEEIEKLEPVDFTKDIENLRKELSNW